MAEASLFLIAGWLLGRKQCSGHTAHSQQVTRSFPCIEPPAQVLPQQTCPNSPMPQWPRGSVCRNIFNEGGDSASLPRSV